MADISQLCERLLIIDRGRLLYDGALGDDPRAIRPGTDARPWISWMLPAVPVQVPHATVVRVDGPRAMAAVPAARETTAADLIAALATRYELRDLTIEGAGD